uniref:Ubiquitin specific peptidase like 1 n=1 Tax=Sphenodon punctatus TaxID=8508 RepID=A0A8D0H6L3_SPHPU
MVSLDILPKAESHLNEIRNIIFAQLQPQLRCKLGQEESPVFALPLLLKKDRQIEKLLLCSYSWKFECLLCGRKHQDRHTKVLTTFTNIVPEWHPLNAVHVAPCNNCKDTSQRRKMILEKMPSVLMMHFVEGLPHNDLKTYSFQFQGDFYQITVVIQYVKDPKHFITWILNSDGTWLECDDLKGPYCCRRERFGVPSSEIHIVIWERKSLQVPQKLSSQLHSEKLKDLPVEEAQSHSPVTRWDVDNSVNKIPVKCPEKDNFDVTINDQQNGVGGNDSNLLSGLEHLTAEDVITLTLVEIPIDSEGKPLENRQMVAANLVAETGILEQQESAAACAHQAPRMRDVQLLPATTNVCTQLENASVSLGQFNQANTEPIVPTNNSSYLPETSHIQGTEAKAIPVAIKHAKELSQEPLPNKRLSLMGDIMHKTSDLKNSRKNVNNSQIATVSAIANSSQPLQRHEKKAFVGSWVKSFLNKCPSFMPGSTSAQLSKEKSYKKPLIQKVTELHPHVKGAENFCGFQAEGTKKAIMKETQKLPPSLSNSTALSPSAHLPIVEKGPKTMNNHISSFGSLDKVVQPNLINLNSKHGHNRHESPKSIVKVTESETDKTHKLRLKLLKKLKAKKDKLALLDSLAKGQARRGSSLKGNGKAVSQLGLRKESESLEGFLRELQHQIDIVDSESLYSTSTTMSLCSSPGNDNFLAELLSPTATVASLENSKDDECRYLEMGSSSTTSPVPSEKDVTCYINNDHNYSSPVRESKREGDTDLLINQPCSEKLNFESPTKEDILDDLLSTSALNSIPSDLDLPHFDESLLKFVE